MADLGRLGDRARAGLEGKHAAREQVLRESRMAIRACANAIRATHRGDRDTAQGLLEDAREALEKAAAAGAGEPEIAHAGLFLDAEKEYAEARVTFAIITGGDVPGPDELSVTDASWLNGLAETVGELRRHLLDVLRAGQLEHCEQLLATMEEIYAVLVTIDFPEGVTGGLRRSTDVARAILERTRGDLTTALVQARLQDALEAHRRDVLGA